MVKRQVIFWLDTDKPEEAELFDYLRSLKRDRGFHSTIRAGVQLVRSLRENRIDELEKQFHFVGDHYRKQVVAASAPIESVQEALERIEQLFMQHTASGGKLSPFEGSRHALPTPNKLVDDDLEIKQATVSEDDKPTWNFMISSALSVYGHCRFLPPDIREYGIRTGRIQTDPAEKTKLLSSIGNAKKMDVPQFGMPHYDDKDLELLVSSFGE